MKEDGQMLSLSNRKVKKLNEKFGIEEIVIKFCPKKIMLIINGVKHKLQANQTPLQWNQGYSGKIYIKKSPWGLTPMSDIKDVDLVITERSCFVNGIDIFDFVEKLKN